VSAFLGDGYGKAVVVVDMQHDVDIGAAIAHIDDAIGSHRKSPAELFDHGHLAVARRHALDGPYLSGTRVEVELRSIDMVG